LSYAGILFEKFVPQKVTINPDSPDTKFILLGEDDPDDQEMLKDVFASIDNSFVLFFVDNGQEILSALEKFTDDMMPCLIVLDYNMPGLSGADILRELKINERYGPIPKIVWSTSGSEKFRSVCLELGAVDYVIKPNNINELEKIARYMLSVCLVN
jgi:DNA-binding response OmpR family regulator